MTFELESLLCVRKYSKKRFHSLQASEMKILRNQKFTQTNKTIKFIRSK